MRDKAVKNIQLLDIRTSYEKMKPEIDEKIRGVLEHGRFILGPEVEELEQELAAFAGSKYCLSCSSGTDALLMPLMLENIGPGDAVFTSPFTFVATAEAVLRTGASPVFVDIDPVTKNIDPGLLASEIKKIRSEGKLKPRAVIPVDLFGIPAEYQAINSIAETEGLIVIEDAAQAFGAEYKGKRAGSLSAYGATSFFPAKPLGCFGDGGAIFTDDKDVIEALRSIRVHGQGRDKYENVRLGINGRMDTLQAAILLVRLKYFPEELKGRRSAAALYTDLLGESVTVPVVPDGCLSAWAQYSIESDKRDLIMKSLQKNDIPSAVFYKTPLHLQPVCSHLGYEEGDFPVSERCSRRILSLPLHPYLSEQEIGYVAESVIASLKS